MFTVYIIFSLTLNRYYIGYTNNIEKRMIDHIAGISSFTSKAIDWELKFTEDHPTRELAMKREKEIKNKKSRRYIEWLISSAG